MGSSTGVRPQPSAITERTKRQTLLVAKQDLRTYGALRDSEGRVIRSTGRNVQFATIVTPELKAWIKTEAKARGKRMCVLLEDMRAAYEKIHGSQKA